MIDESSTILEQLNRAFGCTLINRTQAASSNAMFKLFRHRERALTLPLQVAQCSYGSPRLGIDIDVIMVRSHWISC